MDVHVIGKVARVADGYVIPVIRGRNLIELYKYIPSKQASQLIDLLDQSTKSNGLERIYALAKGYISVASSGGSLHAFYFPYDGSTKIAIDLQDDAGNISSVDDVTILKGRIYIVGSSVVKTDTDSGAVWLYSFDEQFSKDSRKSFRIEIDAAESHQSKFIYSFHDYPSVQVLSRKSISAPPTIRIFKLETKPKMVWDFDLDEIEGNRNAAVAGICTDEYIFARKLYSKDSITTNIEFRIISSNGKEKRVWNEEMVTAGSLLDIDLYPTADRFFSFTNFSKTESARRPDGWYSWLGYRVDRFNIRKECS